MPALDDDFTAFYAAAAPALLVFARAMSRSASDAEDLLQDTFVRMGAAWARIRAYEDLPAYARRTMVRANISRWRALRREVLSAHLPETPARDEFDEALAQTEVARRLASLPVRQRTVLALRFLCGMDDQSIAQHMGLAAGTVRSQASRGLAALRSGSMATACNKQARIDAGGNS